MVQDVECMIVLWYTLEESTCKMPENRIHSMSQVYGFKLSLRCQCTHMYQDYLKNLDDEIMNEVKAKIILYSLLEEYNHLVTILLYEKTRSF